MQQRPMFLAGERLWPRIYFSVQLCSDRLPKKVGILQALFWVVTLICRLKIKNTCQ